MRLIQNRYFLVYSRSRLCKEALTQCTRCRMCSHQCKNSNVFWRIMRISTRLQQGMRTRRTRTIPTRTFLTPQSRARPWLRLPRRIHFFLPSDGRTRSLYKFSLVQISPKCIDHDLARLAPHQVSLFSNDFDLFQGGTCIESCIN